MALKTFKIKIKKTIIFHQHFHLDSLTWWHEGFVWFPSSKLQFEYDVWEEFRFYISKSLLCHCCGGHVDLCWSLLKYDPLLLKGFRRGERSGLTAEPSLSVHPQGDLLPQHRSASRLRSCGGLWRPPVAAAAHWTQIRWKVSWFPHKQEGEILAQQSSHERQLTDLCVCFMYQEKASNWKDVRRGRWGRGLLVSHGRVSFICSCNAFRWRAS